MPRRQRWSPVKGTGSRVYDARERLALGLLDLPGRAVAGLGRGLGILRAASPIDPAGLRDVLVLRLDRIGDVLMSLPALDDLRRALPRARIRLAVGQWSRDVASSAPVDELLVWSAPWAGRANEGADSMAELWRRAGALTGLDLALDLQGDVRASILMWRTRARLRVGYANTGGAYLLTHVVPLDETISWVEQNRRAVESVVGTPAAAGRGTSLAAEVRADGERILSRLGLGARRPLVAIHPGGGRTVKQWPADRWSAVGARLQRGFGAALVLTGSESDRPLVAAVAAGLPEPPLDLAGKLPVRDLLALVSVLDLFLSPDTGPMHMACALDTPSVSVFGPSDPVRYFSGTDYEPALHRVVRAELWCSPCNLIRRPPAECAGREAPECLRRVDVDAVAADAEGLLRQGVKGRTQA
jgi:ADP-heptose:LPS heptosyltransferase